VATNLHAHLSGRMLIAARLAWIAGLLLALVSVAASVPSRYAQLSTVTPAADTLVGQLRPEDELLLAQSGLPVKAYAIYFTAAELLTALVSFGVASLIVWGRSDDWLALVVALCLVAAPTALPLVPALAALHPQWDMLSLGGRVVFLGSLLPLFCLFPDGRFVPRWTRWLTAAWLVYMVIGGIFPRLQPPTGFGRGLTADDAPTILMAALGLLAGVFAQIWRYWRVSSAIERQRTRWVVFGFGVMLATFVLGVSSLTLLTVARAGLGYALARLAGPTFILIGLQAVAVSIGLSIMRYRLWDIDVIIRRTLIYSALSAILAAVYYSSVLLLQRLAQWLTGQGDNPLVVVVSTLAIAALFGPLRARVQRVIDRRFFRQKYNAARTLAGFAASARDETDLARLSTQLVRVVDETMQPESVALWLKAARSGRRSQDQMQVGGG
jgi:hypothetical protein